MKTSTILKSSYAARVPELRKLFQRPDKIDTADLEEVIIAIIEPKENDNVILFKMALHLAYNKGIVDTSKKIRQDLFEDLNAIK